MKTKPKALILKADGTNCDGESFHAFELAGADAKIVHINDLRAKKDSFKNYQILMIPGGFSYGDDIISGKILASELTSFFAEELQEFIARKNTLILGVCNGFQVLIRTGLLPFRNISKMDATLTNNDSGHFECKWVDLKFEKNSKCVFVNSSLDELVSYQIAHGEGKFFAPSGVIDEVEQNGLVVLRYTDSGGKAARKYPENPNGSINAIAGITDPTGRILGLMPHPERFVRVEQHPNWRRSKIVQAQGLPLFKNMVNFTKKA